jgi:hypothetical protein
MRRAPEWSTEKAPRSKFDRNQVEIPRYASIERTLTGNTQGIIRDLQSGRLNKAEAVSRFKQHLLTAETEAFVAGRRARGDRRPDITESEERMLTGRHSRNMRYFTRFVSDVESGRGRMPYHQRAAQYAKSLWSLYTRGETSDWDEPEDVNARYYWVMDPDAEHCYGCLDRAKRSSDRDGFTWEELSDLGWPGENTPCGVNCRCHIRVVRKKLLLPEHFEELEPESTADAGAGKIEGILGGPSLPLKLPLAGAPFVSIAPGVLAEAVATPGTGAAIARYLPTLPNVLTKPDYVKDFGDSLRIYQRGPLDVWVQRNQVGLWEIVAILFAPRKEALA